MIVGDVATRTRKGKITVIMISDVSRAFFEAPMTRDVCIELPKEALNEGEEDQDVVG